MPIMWVKDQWVREQRRQIIWAYEHVVLNDNAIESILLVENAAGIQGYHNFFVVIHAHIHQRWNDEIC